MRRKLLLYLCFCLTLISCGKKPGDRNTGNVNDGRVIYNIENISAYTLGDDGYLYTLEYEDAPESEWGRINVICQYGTDTALLQRFPLDEPLAGVHSLTELGGVVYFGAQTVGEKGIQSSVYSFDVNQCRLVKMVDILEITSIQRVVPDKEGIYVLGNNESGEKENWLFYYSFLREEYERIPMKDVVDIGTGDEGEFVLCRKRDEKYEILQYNLQKEMFRKLCELAWEKIDVIAFGNGGMIYRTVSGNLVWSGYDNPDVKCDLFPDSFGRDYSLCFKNGEIACMGFDRSIGVLSYQASVKNNKTIKVLTTSLMDDSFFNCGYRVEKKECSADKLALKVLAMDSDFDVSILDSFSQTGWNIREKGPFYSLNDVPGVEEYLSMCFPYVKEAATKDDGSIWMFPIDITAEMLMVDEEKLHDLGIWDSFAQMSWEKIIKLQSQLKEEDRKRTDFYNLERSAMMRYFMTNTSVDTSQFRELLRTLQEGEGLFYDNNVQDFLYKRQPLGMTYSLADSYRKKYGEGIRFYGLPGQTELDRNIGTCRFLVVNPKSSNLQNTLDFISTLAAYYCSRAGELSYVDVHEGREDEISQSIYQLYKDLEIHFNIPEELYDGYMEVIEKKKDIEDYIQETEPKLKMFFYE